MSDLHHSSEGDALLTIAGLRIFRPRQVIARAFVETHNHPDAEQVLARARLHDPGVSQATAYRALAALAEKGLLRTHTFDGSATRFDLADRPHHDHQLDVDAGESGNSSHARSNDRNIAWRRRRATRSSRTGSNSLAERPDSMADGSHDSPHDLMVTHGLRPTRQRRVLAGLLFATQGRHVDAQALHAETVRFGQRLSIATVYNALREFERAGLVRRIAVPSERVWYDTDTGSHRHFFIEAEQRILDMPEAGRIEPPTGYRIQRIDTVAHLERLEES